MRRGDLPVLTPLRFFAAAAVVVLHYDLERRDFPAWAAGFGSEAVTFFFILSGFILTYAHVVMGPDGNAQLNIGTARFIYQRFARLLPAYLLALALALPIFVDQHFLRTPADPGTFLTGLVLVPLLLQAWVPSAAQLWNMPAWSLSVELFFYATLPFIVRYTTSTPAKRLVIIAFLTVIGMQLCRDGLQHLLEGRMPAQSHHGFITYFPLFHWPQFLLGVALGRYFLDGSDHRLNTSDWGLMLALLATGAAVYLNPHYDWIASNTVLALVFGGLILAAARASGPLAALFTSRPLQILGEASYAIYILHVPILMYWYRITVGTFGLTLSPAVNFLAYAAVVLGASVACLYLVERPGRKWMLARWQTYETRGLRRHGPNAQLSARHGS